MKKIDAHIHLSSPISNEKMVKNIYYNNTKQIIF